MGADEKVRTSGELSRPDASASVLPTVNPALEKPEPPKSSLHPSVYVMYVEILKVTNPHRSDR
jgi:hypothetical protein